MKLNFTHSYIYSVYSRENLKCRAQEVTSINSVVLWFFRWLTQKGTRQKKINEWLGIKNDADE